MSIIKAFAIVHVIAALDSRHCTGARITVFRWSLRPNSIMVPLSVIASTLILGNTFHFVFIEVGFGGGAIGVAAFKGSDLLRATS